jgi:SPP1 family predicted phage head-tail adaptor
MRAGQLNRVITIQRFTSSVDDDGTPVQTWTDVATVRAQLVQASTDEYIAARGAVDKAVAIFRIRWLDGVTNADRVSYEGTAFNLKEVKEIGRRKGLELRCEALS